MEKSEVVSSPTQSDQELVKVAKTVDDVNSNSDVLQNHLNSEQTCAMPFDNKARDSVNTKVSEEPPTSVGDGDRNDSDDKHSQIINNDSKPSNSINTNQSDAQLCENVKHFNIVNDNIDANDTKDTESANSIDDSTQNNNLVNVTVSEGLAKLFFYNTSDSSSSSSDSDSDEISDDEDTPKDIPSNSSVIDNKYREAELSSESDSTSSADSDSDESDTEVVASGAVQKKTKEVPPPRAKGGELDLEDLPPVPDLAELSIKEEDCIHMGHIESIVDRLVMVQSLPNMPAYDFDTVLFLDNGKRALGHVYDVLGPVTCPMYVIRFNSKEEIETKGIVKDLRVYCAPKMDLTHYVFVKQLLKMKGSDASWKGDNEVPPEFADYSDDDVEFCFSVEGNNEHDLFHNKRKRHSNGTERHRLFESEMNLKNKLDTARHRVIDSIEPASKRSMHRHNYSTPRHAAFNQFAPDPRFNTKPRVPQCPMQPLPFGVLPPPMSPYAVVPPTFAPMPIPPQVYGIPTQPYSASFHNQFSHHTVPSFVTPPPHPYPPPMIPSAVQSKIPLPSEMQQSELLNMLKKMPPPPPPPVEATVVQNLPMHLPLALSTSIPSPSIPKQHMPQNPQAGACQRLFPPNLGLPKPNASIPNGTNNGPCLPPGLAYNYYPHPWQYEMPPPNIRGRQNFQHGRNSFKKQQP